MNLWFSEKFAVEGNTFSFSHRTVVPEQAASFVLGAHKGPLLWFESYSFGCETLEVILGPYISKGGEYKI